MDSSDQPQPTLREFLLQCEGSVVTLEMDYGRTFTGRARDGEVHVPYDGRVNLACVDRAHSGSRHWTRG